MDGLTKKSFMKKKLKTRVQLEERCTDTGAHGINEKIIQYENYWESKTFYEICCELFWST